MDLIEPAVRTFLGIFFLMIGLQFSARTLGLYARMGFSHIYYGARGKATWWHRHIFNVFRAAILLVCLARIFVDLDGWLNALARTMRFTGHGCRAGSDVCRQDACFRASLITS